MRPSRFVFSKDDDQSKLVEDMKFRHNSKKLRRRIRDLNEDHKDVVFFSNSEAHAAGEKVF